MYDTYYLTYNTNGGAGPGGERIGVFTKLKDEIWNQKKKIFVAFLCKKSDSPPSYCCLRLELVRGEEFWREKLGSSSNRLIRLSSSKVKEYISG